MMADASCSILRSCPRRDHGQGPDRSASATASRSGGARSAIAPARAEIRQLAIEKSLGLLKSRSRLVPNPGRPMARGQVSPPQDQKNDPTPPRRGFRVFVKTSTLTSTAPGHVPVLVEKSDRGRLRARRRGRDVVGATYGEGGYSQGGAGDCQLHHHCRRPRPASAMGRADGMRRQGSAPDAEAPGQFGELDSIVRAAGREESRRRDVRSRRVVLPAG